jgi:hypothetical protein
MPSVEFPCLIASTILPKNGALIIMVTTPYHIIMTFVKIHDQSA